jgi:hypothetical protein
MSGAGDADGPRPRRQGSRPLVVAASAAVVALALGGQGLLVPAGPTSTLVRFGGALVSLAAVAVLVRLDGPLRASRTLALVAVAGACTALATLPASPVTIDASTPPAPNAPSDEDEPGTILLDQVDPGDAQDGTVVLSPGVDLEVQGDDVVARVPGGGSTVLPQGQRVARPDGTVVVVGRGALLDVPEPLPADPESTTDGLAEGVDAVLALLLGAFAVLAFAPPLVRAAERVSSPAPVDLPPAPAPRRARPMEESLAEVLRSMLADPDPRTAVIGAYARLLAALDEVGFPRRAEEAPHEHLWRSLGPLGVRRAPVHRLAELFVRARFTPHPVTVEHRQAAIAALADAVADLRLQARDVDVLAGSGGPR